jgi:CBS domain-containing protein
MKLDHPIRLLLGEKGSPVHCVTADTLIYDALVLMAAKEIGALVVLHGERVVGMFSERDYARRVILAGRSSREMRVGEIMSTDVLTVGPSATIDECMQHMTGKRCRHLPVLEDGKLVGIVSIGDLVHWIIRAQNRAIDQLEGYISGDYPH